jgi:peroxiredoxin
MLAVGAVAPEIETTDQEGRAFRLTDAARRLCAVVYFFPKAFTPGCTKETAAFRDNYNELRFAGAGLVGVSSDDVATQCEFAKSLTVEFPMLADPTGVITKGYDVRWPLIPLAQRVTYVVDPSRKVLHAFHDELRIDRHRDDVLRAVDALYEARQRALRAGA